MILTDNETKLDLLNNQAIARTIVSIIRDSKDSISIGVHGDWGAGKSSILAMVDSLINPENTDEESNDEDDLDWENLDEEDPEDAVEPEKSEDIKKDYVTIRFNSWQYQGFEDAKIALMCAIVKALQKEARNYYKKHPVKGAFKKLKETCKNIWKNLDKLSLAKNIGKIGFSLATSTTPIALLDIVARCTKDIISDDDKRNELITAAGELLKNTSIETSSYKEMAEFRANYADLFKASHAEKLVVLIDDLDRCLPKVAIETLEAIRMFLSMEDTAFIIAADDEMIRYSVKEYFPRISDKMIDEDDGSKKYSFHDFSDKYLEKLIQVPLHIPMIGIPEAQLYILLLLVESEIGESDSFKKLVDIIIGKLHKPWALEPITTEDIQEALGEDYDKAVDKIKIAKSIDRILAENTSGNPRNIKRFINMLLLRTKIANDRGYDELKMAILAKLMLVEQYNYDFYKMLATTINDDGVSSIFDIEKTEQTEQSNSDSEEKTDTNSETNKKTTKGRAKKGLTDEIKHENEALDMMLKEKQIKKWMKIEPSLSRVDLRPYYFACKEAEDFFFTSTNELLRELAAIIRGGKLNVTNNKKKFEELEETDARKLFKVVSQEAFNTDLSISNPPKIIEGIRRFVEYRAELQGMLVDFLLTLPTQTIGIWALAEWDLCIPKNCESRGKLIQFFKKIGETSNNDLTRARAQQLQE